MVLLQVLGEKLSSAFENYANAITHYGPAYSLWWMQDVYIPNNTRDGPD